MDSSRDIVRKLRENRILNERTNYENMDRDELVKLAKDGDQLAFSTLIDTHEEFFYKMTKKYVSEGVFERDDILQIAEIAFWEAVQSWNGSGDFEAYAGMVVKRRLVDEYRKQFTDKSIANRDTKSLDAVHDEDDEDYYASGQAHLNKDEFGSWMDQQSRSAEDEYIDQEGVKALSNFLAAELTEQERQVIDLYIKGYKMAKISEVTGMKYKSCENALRRAKGKLLEYMRGIKESKILKEDKESLFSDAEKKILRKALSMIEENKSINEATKDIKNYEEFTFTDFENELGNIEDQAEKIIERIRVVKDFDEYSKLLEQLDDLKSRLWDIEDYLEDVDDEDEYLYKYYERVERLLLHAKDTETEELKYDPYKEIGMSRSDFF